MSVSNRSASKRGTYIGDKFSGTPETTFWSKWFGGVITPLFCFSYGLYCCISQQAVFIGSRGITLDVSGKIAILLGLAWISGALFLHFHYFWPTFRRLWILTDFGKIISLIALIVTFGYAVWSIIMG